MSGYPGFADFKLVRGIDPDPARYPGEVAAVDVAHREGDGVIRISFRPHHDKLQVCWYHDDRGPFSVQNSEIVPSEKVGIDIVLNEIRRLDADKAG